MRKINTDGTDSSTLNDSDVLISYEGCGCAGGQVTTIESERVPIPNTTNYARRKQKIYEDILGRGYKTETFEWDGTTVYSTVTSTYNGRDQVVLTREYSGTTSSEVFQDTTATFDGFGRLASSHRPEQRDNSNNLKYTTYTYNPDDSIQSLTDGRTVQTSYTYNNRGLITNIAWNVGSTGIADTPDVSFAYDDLGNRTQMTDRLGQVDYEYDSLSRMIAETRDFTDTLVDSPIGGGKFKLEYTYDLIGLKSYTDPYGKSIEYANDKIGRVSAIAGTSFGGVTSYLSNPQFRAWGALKYVQYGSNTQSATTYDNRLRPATYLLNSISEPTTYKTFDKAYEYYSDGRLKVSDEAIEVLNKFDRLFKYDHQGRILEAKSGTEAHGTAETDLAKLPYRQSYSHDAFGNLTGRDSTLWNYTGGDWDFEYTMQNNRDIDSGYDADGRQLFDPSQSEYIYFYFDAAGKMEKTIREDNYESLIYQDGAGAQAKRSQRVWDPNTNSWGAWESVYFINSTILGRTLTETTQTGRKKYTYVVSGGSTIARQELSGTNVESISWQFTDESGLSSSGFDNAERDGLGNNVGKLPFVGSSRTENSMTSGQSQTFTNMGMGDCSFNGTFMPCSMAQMMNDGHSFFAGNPRFPFEVGGRNASTRSSLSGQSLLDGGSYTRFEFPDIWDESTLTLTNGGFLLVSGDTSTTGHGPPTIDAESPCELMAQNAQFVYDHLTKDYPAILGSDRLIEFARIFQTLYTGGWVGTTSISAANYWRNYKGGSGFASGTGASGSTDGPGGPMSNLPWNDGLFRGQKDFKSIYKEESSKGDEMDQTHHFAAYFALGVADLSFANSRAVANDDIGGTPDKLLGAKAYEMGDELRKNNIGLKNIGRKIRQSICVSITKEGGRRSI